MFERDPQTQAVLMIGEIGGTSEEEAARFAKANMKKPIAAFIAGQTRPPASAWDTPGAIISGGKGTAGREDRRAEVRPASPSPDAAELARRREFREVTRQRKRAQRKWPSRELFGIVKADPSRRTPSAV
jgi:hypothetical protein